MKPCLFLILATALLAGCTTPKMNTPSGRPEETIRVISLETLQSALTSRMIDRKYLVTRADPLVMVFEKDADNAMASLLFGTSNNPYIRLRVTYNLIKQDKAFRVIAGAEILNGNRIQPAPGAYPTIAQWLELLRQDLETARP